MALSVMWTMLNRRVRIDISARCFVGISLREMALVAFCARYSRVRIREETREERTREWPLARTTRIYERERSLLSWLEINSIPLTRRTARLPSVVTPFRKRREHHSRRNALYGRDIVTAFRLHAVIELGITIPKQLVQEDLESLLKPWRYF